MKTLLLALISAGKSKGTREGAIRGLIGVGKEAVRKGLIEGGGAMIVGSECHPGETGPLVDAVMVCLMILFHIDINYLGHTIGRIPSTAFAIRCPRAIERQ
jgi:hypothetical protein